MNKLTVRKKPSPSIRKVGRGDQSLRFNISLPMTLCEVAPMVFRRHGFGGLSDYVQGRLRKDAGLDLKDNAA